jgi:hypothetical protein
MSIEERIKAGDMSWREFKSVVLGRHSSLWNFSKKETIKELEAYFSKALSEAREEGESDAYERVNAINKAAKESNKMQRKMVDDYELSKREGK